MISRNLGFKFAICRMEMEFTGKKEKENPKNEKICV
jgi:hypothetical protein